jgi:hypothetical protein
MPHNNTTGWLSLKKVAVTLLATKTRITVKINEQNRLTLAQVVRVFAVVINNRNASDNS